MIQQSLLHEHRTVLSGSMNERARKGQKRYQRLKFQLSQSTIEESKSCKLHRRPTISNNYSNYHEEIQ